MKARQTVFSLTVRCLPVALCAFVSGMYASEVYRVDRTFEPVTINCDGTISGIVSNAERLTGIIGPVSLHGLNESAAEKEFISWGQPNSQQAWTNVVTSAKATSGYYMGSIGGYSQAFDDPGWIKGIKEAYEYSGAYLWYLQNRLQFYSSASSLYQTNGYIYGIETVHVGTLGDFAPAVWTNIFFPLLDEPASTNWNYTRMTSESPGSSAETVIYRYDRTAYYKIVDLVQTLVAKDAANPGNEVKDETPVDNPCSTLYVGQNASGMATVNVTFAWDSSLTNASLRWSFTRTNGIASTEWINGNGIFTSSTITAVWTNVANAAREFNLWAWYDMPTNQMGPGPLQPNGIRDPLEPHRMVKVHIVKVDLDVDTDRDGAVESVDDESGEETNTVSRGALITPPLRALASSNNTLTGLSSIQIDVEPRSEVQGLGLRLVKLSEPSNCRIRFITRFGVLLGDSVTYNLTSWPTSAVPMYVMPEYARPYGTATNQWPISFDIGLEVYNTNDNTVIGTDHVQLKVAPMILPPECNTPQKIYTTSIDGIPGTTSMNATNAGQWAQDMVKFVKYQTTNSQAGEMFVDLEHSVKGSFPAKLRSDEGWNGTNVWSVAMLGDGGNIMATPSLPDAPFGKLLIGSSQGGHPDPLPYWAGQGVQPVVRITNDWLMVGHVDEILMWVASDKVLYADPWKAADLLHQEIAVGNQTNKLWFGFDAAGTNKTIQQVVIAPNGGSFKLTTLPAPGLSNSASPATLVFSSTMFVTDDILRVDDEILEVTSANGPTVTVARAQAGRPFAAHAAGNVIYAYTDTMQDNLTMGVDSVVAKIAVATNQLRQAIGTYSATFVPMPVLFDKPSGYSTYVAASANVVNCLLSTGGTICYSETGCTVFRDYISSVLPTVYDVPGGWEGLHCAYGEIHCATAAQRELDLAEPWWEQVDDWE